mgnify:CR=1 FL=1|tara:strand:+ start:377 stop:550 length:174 start_codon:yes stop_codon:yes gene_type:complete
MRSDPATEFLGKFIAENQDVLDDKMIDPETGLPREDLEAGLFTTARDRRQDYDDEEE